MRQRDSVSVCAASLCFLTVQPEWTWFHGDRQSQSETDMTESSMSAAADRPWLVEEADARVADSKGKPTDTTSQSVNDTLNL